MIWKLTDNKAWSALEKQFSWVDDMQHVQQHKQHHAEGNVAIHTQMVLEQLQQLAEYDLLDEQSKEILWASALMHDIEKRSTSVDEGNGIIHAAGHARRGEGTVREILFRDVETPFYIRERIASLVKLHGLPLWLMEKHEPMKKILDAAFRVDTRQLKMIAEADARGRICEDLGSLLYALDMFELYCKEQNCWGKAKEFATPNARYQYFDTDDSYVDYVPFDNFKCRGNITSRIAGYGKRSLSKIIR